MSELSEFLFGVRLYCNMTKKFVVLFSFLGQRFSNFQVKFFINTLKALNPSNQIAAIGVGKNSWY